MTTKVEWYLGLLCNFSCSYCAEWVRSGFAEKEKILRGVDLLKKRVGHRKIFLLLSGGEPSIHPDIREIVAHMASQGFYLGMISNGSRKPELYLEMLENIKAYTFSVHFEMRYKDTLATIMAVYEKILELNRSQPQVPWHLQVNMMMAPGYFDEAKKVLTDLIEQKIPFIIRRIRPLFDKLNQPILPQRVWDRQVYSRDYSAKDLSKVDWGYYTETEVAELKSFLFKVNKNTKEYWRGETDDIQEIESNVNDVTIRKLNRFLGWKCWVGIERLHIYPNGDVFRSSCKVGGKLGNIYDDFVFPNEPITCKNQRCSCSWSMNVSKAKDLDAMKLLEKR